MLFFFLDKSNRIVKTSAGQLAWSENAPLVNFLGESPSFVRHRKNLPIYQYRREILDQILSQRVVIVMGQTGCGKTTQLPQYILEEAYEKKKPCRIICIQPHRILTIAAANQVTTERGMLAEEKKRNRFSCKCMHLSPWKSQPLVKFWIKNSFKVQTIMT